MPPEPLPWDRKDFFKERKHHNNNSSHHQIQRSSESSLGGGSLTRWRDYHLSSSHHSREFARWESDDFCRRPGHGKQGGWHLFAEESALGYAPSRSSDKMPEDESTRISVSRGDGKHGRNSRENRSSVCQRDWKGHAWDMSNGYATTPGRLHNVNCDQRSVDDMLVYPSHPQSNFVNTWVHPQLKDHHDNKIGGVNGLGTSQRCERENSLDLKIKWTRSGSLSSRGSGLSHSSSSKSMGGVDSSDGKTDLQPKNATPVQSPSGDAATYVTSGAPSEETTSRKKPRLGWGEGLAKYEKKKVEVPDVSVNRDALFNSSSNTEPLQSLSSNLAEKSPRVVGFLDCASPETPSSVACSYSPGLEEKAFCKALNVDNDGRTLCGSPSIGSQNHLEGFLFNLEKLDTNSISNLGSSLVELLQCEGPSLGDSSFVRSTAMNKLLVWKGDVLKTLETTESEIDALENELKSLKSALGSTSPCPATSTSLSVEDNCNQFNEKGVVSNSMARPAPLQNDCGDVTVKKMPDCSCGLEEIHAGGKDEDIDSPGTATSKFVEPSSFVKPVSPSDMIKNGESFGVLDATHTTNTEVKCIVPGSLEEGMTGVSTCGDGGMVIESKNTVPVPSDCCAYPDGENTLCDVILGANKELANEASELFNKLLPRDHKNIDISGVANVFCGENDSLIKEKFAKRKQFLRFKERVLTLKFKALQHLWKGDLRLLSIRKYRARSQKKCELSLRSTYTGYQKHRSSIRSRFSSPAGNLSLVPTAEVINFTSKLLSDSQIKVYRDSLKMPTLILDKKEKTMSRFISSNGLVEDPCAAEKERAMINPWTSEEREIFMDKLATFGKDFRKIASFLDYKTTADCVEYYYKNHKSDCFEKLKKQDRKQGKTSAFTYLVTSGKRNRKMNAASLDILGEASEMAAAAQADSCRLINSGRISLGGRGDSRTSLVNDGIMERSSGLDVVGSEKEIAAADVLAVICGSLSSEAMGSCITSSVDPGEGQRDWKHQKVDSIMRLPSTSDVTLNVDNTTCSDDGCGEIDPSDWTDEEKSIFIQAVSSYGKDFPMVARCVRTRSRDQCKVFFSKARKCLGLDLMCTDRGNVGTSVNDDANGSGSDTEDACVLETSSVICSDKLGSKMDEDLPTHVMNSNQNESCAAGAVNLQTDLNKSEDDNGMALLDDEDSEAVKPLIYDACKSESRSFELEGSSMNGMDNQSESVLDQKNTVVLFKTAVRDQVAEQCTVSVSAGEAVDPCPSSSNAVEETNDVVAEASSMGFGNGLLEHELMLLENSLNEERDRNCNVDVSGESEMVQDSNTTGSAFDLYVDTSSHSVSLKLDSVDKPPVISLLQENSLPATTSIPQDSSSVIQCEKTLNQNRLSPTHDLQRSKDESFHKTVGSNDYRPHLSGHSIVKLVESPILNGYPLSISTKKEMNGDVNCRPFSEVQSISKLDRNIDGPYLAQDCYLRKCISSTPHSSITELPLLSQNIEQTSDCPRAHYRSLSDTEKPCKNGDVKLFGKILSHPLSSRKLTFSRHENGEKGHHQKHSNKASNLKFSAHLPADCSAALLKNDRNNYLGLENVPVRSYGFWDGNRIQTGFSLPDSTILLAKYPAAFSSYSASSSKMEPQSLQAAVVKGNEHNLNGVAVLPPREISSSNGVVDYPVYRSRDGTKMQQPFSVDMKQRQDLLVSEIQRRNGLEALSSLQQQQQGVNVVGRRGGILVGGGLCTGGVSDPVAAIKMHYAKAEQYGGQGGSSIREGESWRGKGDIGR